MAKPFIEGLAHLIDAVIEACEAAEEEDQTPKANIHIDRESGTIRVLGRSVPTSYGHGISSLGSFDWHKHYVFEFRDGKLIVTERLTTPSEREIVQVYEYVLGG